MTPPDAETIVLNNFEARPVEVIHPATIPAMLQAEATVIVPLPPASNASMILEILIRLSELNKPTMMVTRIAIAAELCIVLVPLDTRITSTTSGVNRYSLRTK